MISRLHQIGTIACVLACVMTGVAAAEDFSSFKDDFNGTWSEKWNIPDTSALKLDKVGDRGVLVIGRNSKGALPRLFLMTAPFQWKDFTLEVEMQRVSGMWGGVGIRGGYDLFLDDKNRLIIRKDYQVLKMTEPIEVAAGSFVKLKVIGVGGVLRVAINGTTQIELKDQPAAMGACGLMVHEAEVKFGAFSITADAALDAAVKIGAEPKEGALIFPPAAAINLPLAFDNQSATTWKTDVRATLTLADASDDIGNTIAGLTPDDQLVARRVGDGVELSISGDGPFERSRIGYRYITLENPFPTVYMHARIRRSSGEGAGFVFGRSSKGHNELYFDGRGKLVLRRIAPKDTQVLAVSEASYPVDQDLTLDLIAEAERVTASVNGTEAFPAVKTPDISGDAGLLFNQTAVAFNDLQIATTKADQANAWKPKLAAAPRKFTEATSPLSLPPGKSQLTVALPAAAEGYYLLTVSVGDGAVKTTYPVGVWNIDPDWSKAKSDQIPLAVYGKYDWPGDDIASDTYVHAVCWTLRKHGLNGVLHPFTDKRQLDILRRYGIEPVLRSPMAQWATPSEKAIIFVGDEPKVENAEAYRKEYEQIQSRLPTATLLTCMVGEVTGKGTSQDPLKVWESLKPAQRMLRHYPDRRVDFDILNPNPDQTPFLQALDRTAAIETPWYFVVQTFGRERTTIRPAPFWRDPTGVEVQAICNTALAYGARGLFFYTLQTEGGPALVYPRSLAACDEKLAALGEFAKSLQKIEPILLAAKPAKLELKPDATQIIAKSFTSGGANYAYLVNADSKASHKATVSVNQKFARATDQVSGKSLPCKSETDMTRVEVEIAPGQGAIVRFE